MTKTVDWSGRGLLYNARFMPSAMGIGDIGHPHKVHTYPEPDNPNFLLVITRMHCQWGAGGSTDPIVDCSVLAGRRCCADFRIGADQMVTQAATNTYSFAIEHRISSDLQWAPRRIFDIYDDTTGTPVKRWGIQLTNDPTLSSPNQVTIVNESGTVIAGPTTWGRNYPNTWYRYEVSVQATTSKVTLKMYVFSGGSWVINGDAQLTANPTSVLATHVSIGVQDDQKDTLAAVDNFQFAKVRIWDTTNFDGGGFKNDWVYPAVKHYWWDGTTKKPMLTEPQKWDGTTKVSAGAAFTSPFAFRATRKMAIDAGSRAVNGYTEYNGGLATNEAYLVYTPPGDAPPGGWPVVLWVTTNYFVSGTYQSMASDHYSMLQALLNHGWAVASTGVPLCNVLDPTTGPRFPQAIKSAKAAARHMMANAAYHNINPAKVVFGGHSSGGYIANAAMVTRDLANNGYGVDMRLGGGADPEPLGGMAFSIPVDFARTWTEDPTAPVWGNDEVNLFGTGSVRAAIAAWCGQVFTQDPLNTDGIHMHNWVDLNYAKCKPMWIQYSTGDIIIPPHNATSLAARLAANGVPYTLENAGNVPHQFCTSHYRQGWKAWLNSLV